MSLRRMIPAGPITLALAFGALSRADEVTLIRNTTFKQATGEKVRGTVQSETPSEVVVKLGNSTINVPVDQVVSIQYSGQPASMALAESNENSGQLAKALDLYKKAAAEAEGKPLIEQAARFKAVEVAADLALADPARAGDAIAQLDGFVRAHPGSRHTGRALESLARLQLQKGDFAQVERTIASLSKVPAGADRAGVLRARVSAKKGDHAAAITELDRLIKSSPEGSARAREARLAKSESLAGLKKYGEAEADVRAVIKATPAEDVAAQSAAYNTLGDCLRAAGRPKDALLAFLHTDLVFSKDKEQHPRALAQIAQIWRELKRDDRADETIQRLKQDYPQSPWLARATP